MSNRIGKYVRNATQIDLNRARDTLEFCAAIWRMHDDEVPMPAERVIALTLLQNEAAELIEDIRVSKRNLRRT
jgi:hypothetical protein